LFCLGEPKGGKSSDDLTAKRGWSLNIYCRQDIAETEVQLEPSLYLVERKWEIEYGGGEGVWRNMNDG
jgi:hypothetical protein